LPANLTSSAPDIPKRIRQAVHPKAQSKCSTHFFGLLSFLHRDFHVSRPVSLLFLLLLLLSVCCKAIAVWPLFCLGSKRAVDCWHGKHAEKHVENIANTAACNFANCLEMAKCFPSTHSPTHPPQAVAKTLGNANGSCWINYEKYQRPSQCLPRVWFKCIVVNCSRIVFFSPSLTLSLSLLLFCTLSLSLYLRVCVCVCVCVCVSVGQQLNCLLSVTVHMQSEQVVIHWGGRCTYSAFMLQLASGIWQLGFVMFRMCVAQLCFDTWTHLSHFLHLRQLLQVTSRTITTNLVRNSQQKIHHLNPINNLI